MNYSDVNLISLIGCLKFWFVCAAQAHVHVVVDPLKLQIQTAFSDNC